jgi:hypothetical protein
MLAVVFHLQFETLSAIQRFLAIAKYAASLLFKSTTKLDGKTQFTLLLVKRVKDKYPMLMVTINACCRFGNITANVTAVWVGRLNNLPDYKPAASGLPIPRVGSS